MLVNTQILKTQGDLGGKKIDMSIDENSLTHLMSVLSDLYSDKIMAVVREYSTNALDSHIASGQTRPVELSTPTALSPYFVVRDYGVGMDEQDIENIYSKYGASSKRDNNDESGMLGLGCKSGLTYSNQFTLTGIKNGVKTLVAISRSANGAGTMEVVDVSPSDEPNGVTIKVPVNSSGDREYFRDTVNRFVQYIDNSKIRVDGKAYAHDFEVLNDRIWIKQSNYGGYVPSFVVMGNVAYPIARTHFDTSTIPNRHGFVYFADMGDVNFPPSREELMYTTRTEATLRKIEQELPAAFTKHLQHVIDSASTIREAFNQQTSLNRRYGNSIHGSWWQFEYKGETLPKYIQKCKRVDWDTDGKEPASSGTETLFESPDTSRLYIYNWKNKVFNKLHGLKITKWLEKSDDFELDTDMAYLMDEVEHPALFEGCSMVDWNEIKRLKTAPVPKAQRPKRMWPDHRGYLKVPDETKQIYFEGKERFNTGYAKLLDSDNSEFYYVAPSQQERFKKVYPKAELAAVGAARVVIDWVKNLTQSDLDSFKLYVDFREAWALKSDEILDPELKLISSSSDDFSWQNPLFRMRDSMEYLSNWADQTILGSVKVPQVEYKGQEVIDRYPLLVTAQSYRVDDKEKYRDHMTDYVNAVYEKEIKGV